MEGPEPGLLIQVAWGVLKYALQRFRFKKVCSYRVVDFSWRCGGCTEEGMSHHSPGRVQAGFAKVIMLGEGLSGE